MPDPDLQIRVWGGGGGAVIQTLRYKGEGGGGRSSRPLDKGEPVSKKIFFLPFEPQFRLLLISPGSASELATRVSPGLDKPPGYTHHEIEQRCF